MVYVRMSVPIYLDFGNDQELNSSVQRRQTVPQAELRAEGPIPDHSPRGQEHRHCRSPEEGDLTPLKSLFSGQIVSRSSQMLGTLWHPYAHNSYSSLTGTHTRHIIALGHQRGQWRNLCVDRRSDPALWHRREEAVCLPRTSHFACVWQDISDALAGRHICSPCPQEDTPCVL